MIAVIKKPQIFSPAKNSMIWQVQSDNVNLAYFNVKVIDPLSSGIISTKKLVPSPRYSGVYCDLTNDLKNIVRWELSNNSYKLITPLTKPVRSYSVELTEMLFNGGVITSGATYSSTLNPDFVWNAEMGRIGFNNFTVSKYLINSNNQISFLTNKPNHAKVNDISNEFLCFLQNGSVEGLSVRVRTFNKNAQVIQTKIEQVPLIGVNKMYQVNCSPKSLIDSSNFDFAGVRFYVVDLINTLQEAVSEERVYFYGERDCNIDYLNVIWINRLGGIDAYSFTTPKDSMSVDRFTMKKNIHQINSDGIYSDQSGGIYNPSEVIISTRTQSSVKVTSQILTDAEAYWLQDLYMSEQCFIELANGDLCPASLVNSTYDIPKQKYNRQQLNTIDLEFKLAEGVIPTGMQAYGGNSGKNSLEFIDSQMWSIETNIPGYGVEVDPAPNQYDDDNYSVNDYS